MAGIYLITANASGTINPTTFFAQAKKTIQVGNPAQQISVDPASLKPTPNSTIDETQPLISATIIGPSAYIDIGSIQLNLDGNVLVHSYDSTDQVVSYAPPTPLSATSHTVNLDLQDTFGRPVSASWSFTIQPSELTAQIVITPDTWYTEWADDPRGSVRCYIGELPGGQEVTEIDINKVKLNDTVPANTSRYRIKDSQPGFAGKVMEVMFNRHDAFLTLGSVSPGDAEIVKVSGELTDGTQFMGETTITIQELQAAPAKPAEFALYQNYPNSFNPDTWIPYQLAEDMYVTIRIHDVTGRLIRTLGLGHKLAGFYVDKSKAAYWNGRNETGEYVASGVYFYTIQAGKFTDAKKMMLRK
jgi:hypothetical protein